jgi:predicted nucleic acid-binding protein
LTARVFVDTNVLVYLRDSTEPDKQRRAAEWLGHLWESGSGRLSLQVLQEYYVTMTRKLEPGLPEEEAREDVAALGTWSPLVPDMELMESGWAEQDRYGFSFWDALIVAAARRLGCAIVLTEDLQDGQDLGGMVVRNPFTTPPGPGVS